MAGYGLSQAAARSINAFGAGRDQYIQGVAFEQEQEARANELKRQEMLKGVKGFLMEAELGRAAGDYQRMASAYEGAMQLRSPDKDYEIIGGSDGVYIQSPNGMKRLSDATLENFNTKVLGYLDDELLKTEKERTGAIKSASEAREAEATEQADIDKAVADSERAVEEARLVTEYGEQEVQQNLKKARIDTNRAQELFTQAKIKTQMMEETRVAETQAAIDEATERSRVANNAEAMALAEAEKEALEAQNKARETYMKTEETWPDNLVADEDWGPGDGLIQEMERVTGKVYTDSNKDAAATFDPNYPANAPAVLEMKSNLAEALIQNGVSGFGREDLQAEAEDAYQRAVSDQDVMIDEETGQLYVMVRTRYRPTPVPVAVGDVTMDRMEAGSQAGLNAFDFRSDEQIQQQRQAESDAAAQQMRRTEALSQDRQQVSQPGPQFR